MLELEEKFRSYLQKTNDLTATYRHQVITSALNVRLHFFILISLFVA